VNSIKEFFSDLAKYIPSFVVPSLISIISYTLFTRYIAPKDWAINTLVSNTTDLFITVVISWVTVSVIRFYEGSLIDNKAEQLLSSVTFFAVAEFAIAGLMILVAGRFFSGLIDAESMTYVWAGYGLFVISAASDLTGAFLRAGRQVRTYSSLVVVQNLTRLGLGFIFIVVFHWGVLGLLWGYISGFAVGLIGLGLKRYPLHIPRGNFSWAIIKQLFIFGMPLVGGTLAYWLLRTSDRYILWAYVEPAQVGIYSVAFDISDKTMMMLVTLLSTASYPLVVQIWEKNGANEVTALLPKLMRVYLILCVPAMVGIAVLNKPLMSMMAGEAYFSGHIIIPLIVLSTFLFGFKWWYQMGLALYQHTTLIMISALLGGGLNILLNLLLVPEYGIYAAMINNLVGYALLAVLIVIFSRRYIRWNFPTATFVKVSISALLMAIPLWIFQDRIANPFVSFAIFVPLGCVIYAAALLFFKEISGEQMRSYRQLILKR
jgi:O-antigen/teichoic acid export membrane protein